MEALREFADICHKADIRVTRDLFREEGNVPRVEWERYFGTWEEFQRQAGIKQTRGQRQLDLHIARHASRDMMETFKADRENYQGKYLKPSGKRFRTALVASDFHDIDCDPFVRRMFIEAARRISPEVIFFNGDMLDLPEFGRYTVDPRTWDPLTRIKWLHEFLSELREICPDAEIIYLEGNHEFRLLRHLAESTPALKTLLSDLHGFTMPKLLGLDEYEVVYVGKADLKAWTNTDTTREIARNTYFLWDMLLADHFPTGVKQGVPGWNGHHHKWGVTPIISRMYGSSMWVQIAGGHVRNAEYCEGEQWHNGFLIVHADVQEKKSRFEIVDIGDFCVLGGEFYFRDKSEIWHKNQTIY